MSQVIDERVVEMNFDNENFERNVQTSLKTIEELKKSLKFEDAGKELDRLSEAADNIDFSNLEENVQSLADRFSTSGIIAMTAIQDITRFAEKKIGSTVKSISDMIVQGGKNRALNIEKAKFQLEGLGVAWSDIKEDIEYGVNDTAYGLDAAANAASQLVASGVTIGDNMKTALRGISGVAAMTASSYEEISSIFTTVAGQGKLMTIQLRQLENRGLNAAAILGQQLGYTEAQVREMVSDGLINFDMFASAMDSAFGEHAKDANKTFTGVVSNIKAAFGRIGASFITPFVENDGKLVHFLQSIRNSVSSFQKFVAPTLEGAARGILNIIEAIQKIGTQFTILKGWQNIWTGIKNVLISVLNVLTPFVNIFRVLFDDIKISGAQLAIVAAKFANFSKTIGISTDYLGSFYDVLIWIVYILKTLVSISIKKFVEGVSSVISCIGWAIDIFKELKSHLNEVPGIINDAIASLSNFTGIDLSGAWAKLTEVLGKVKTFIEDIGVLIRDLFSNLNITSYAAQPTERVATALQRVNPLLKTVSSTVSVVSKGCSTLFSILKTILTLLNGRLVRVLTIASKLIKSINLDDIKSGLSSISNTVTGVVKKLQDVFGQKEGIWDAYGNRIDKTNEKFKNFSEVVKEFFNYISGAGTITAYAAEPVMDLSDRYVYASGEVTKSANTIATANNQINKSAQVTTNKKESIPTLLERLAEAFEKAKPKIKEFVETLKGSITQLDWSKVMVAGIIIVLINALTKLTTAFYDVSTTIASVGKVVSTSIAGFFDAWASLPKTLTEVAKTYAKKTVDIGDSMLKVSASIGLLAASLWILSEIPVDKLKQSGIVLGVIAAGVLAFSLALAAISKIDAKNDLTGVAISLVAFAASIAIITMTLKSIYKTFESITGDGQFVRAIAKMAVALGALTVVMTMLAAFSVAISHFAPQLTSGSLFLISFAVAIKLIGQALTNLAEQNNYENMEDALKYLGTIMTMLSLLALACSRMKFGSAVGVFLVIHAVSKIQDMLIDIGSSELSFAYIKEHLEQFAIVLGVIATVSLALMVSGKYAVQGAIAVALITLMGERLTDCIEQFQKLFVGANMEAIEDSLLSVLVIVGSLGVVMALTSAAGQHALGASIGIALLVGVAAGLTALMTHFANNYSPSVLNRVEGALVCISACLSGLIFATKFTKDVKISALISLSVMIAMLAGTLALLAAVNDARGLLNAAKSLSLVLVALGIALVGASTLSKDVNTKAVVGIIATAATAAVGLWALTQVDMTKLLAATLSLGTILTTLILGFNSIEEGTKEKLLGVGLMVGTLTSVAYALYQLQQYKWDSLLGAAGSISLVMLAMAGCFQIISGTEFNLKNAGTVVAGVATLGVIAYSLYQLCSVSDYNTILAAATGLSEVLLALTVSIGILSAVGTVATGAIAGIGAMDLLILDLVGMVEILGLMYQSETVQKLIADGGKAFGMVGEAIGSFIGGIAGGAASKFTESLPSIGTNLSTFGENLQGFISNVTGIDSSVVESTKLLVEAIATMAGANFISGLSGIFGSDDAEGFGEKLAVLGGGVARYAESIRTLEQGDIDKVKLSAEALYALTAVADSIPNSGGWLGKVFGDNDIDVFAEKIGPYGTAIVAFAGTVSELTEAHVAAVQRAATASQAMTDFAKTIPNSGGWLGEVFGDNDIDDFGTMLKKFAESLFTVSETCLTITPEHITALSNVKNASQELIDLSNTIGNSGGLVSGIIGDNTLEDFGKGLVKFIGKLEEFTARCVKISWSDLSDACNKVRTLIALCNSTIDIDTSSFAKLNTAMLGAARLAIDTFTKEINKTGPKDIKKAIEDAINNALDVTKVDCKSKFHDLGKEFGDEFANGIEDSEDDIHGSITALVNGALNSIDDAIPTLRSAGARAGQAVIDGFGGDDGIDPWPQSDKAYEKTDAVKNGSVNSLSDALPVLYKAAAKAGGAVVDGLGETISNGLPTTLNNIVKDGEQFVANVKGKGSVLDAVLGFFGTGTSSSSSSSSGAEETSKAIDGVTEALNGTTAAVGKTSSAVSSASDSTKKSLNVVDYATGLIYKYRDSYIALTSAISESDALNTSKSDVQEFAIAVYEAMGNSVEYTEDGITKILENFQTFTEDFQKNIKEQMTSIDEFTQSFDISPKSISKNLQANQTAIDDYLRYIRQAARNGIDKETLINIINGGFSQESYNKVRVYASMTKAEITAFNDSISNAATLSKDKMESTLSSVMASYNGAIANINDKTLSWKSSTGMAVNEIISTLERAKLTYDEQLQAISDTLSGTIATFEEFSVDEDNAMTADKMEENLDSRIEAVNEWSEAMQDLLDRGISQELYEKLRDMGWEDGYTYVMALKDASDEQLDSIGDKFLEALSMEGTDSGEISSQIASKTATVWTEGLGEAIKGIGEALVTGNLTEEYGGAFYELAKQSVAQYWGDLDTLMNQNSVSYAPEFAKAIEQAFDPQLTRTVFANFAAEAPNGLAEGLTSEESKRKVSDAAVQLMTEAISALDEARMEETGSLEKLQSACSLVSNTMAASIVKDINVPADAAGDLSQAIVTTTEGIITLDKFIEIGNYIIDGLKDSIYDGKSDVVAAIREMCQDAVDAAEEEFDINSPSKVMQQIGKYVDQGFGIGIVANAGSVTESITELSDTALDAFNGVIIRLSDYLENGINAQPVISPVLDMSNMDAGLAYANSLAGKNFKIGSLSGRAYNLMSSIGDNSSDSSNTATGGNSYQFIQNNYSPKALSRVDIYRQTNNQFTRMKGLVEAG
jgi:tape measure domain-containing protein